MKNEKLSFVAKVIRQEIFQMITDKGGGHYGGSLSAVEILVSLFYKVISPGDRFVLSKAHAGAALYAVLASKKIIDKKLLKTYGKEGSVLGIHPERELLPQIEFSSGSLGHGLSFSIGLAMGLKKLEKSNNVYCLIGDGESQEGSVWEAALFAAQHKIGNIIAITDFNKKQSSGLIKDILGLDKLKEKWKAFGWHAIEVDGHSFKDLNQIFYQINKVKEKPTMIIAHTIKGKGISFLENREMCHHDKLSEKEINIAQKELL
jgi:transketolase